MEIRKIPVHKINIAPYNPRIDLQKDDPIYQKLEKSIKEFGYIQPLVWNEHTGNLVGGHQRFKVLIEAGYQEVECSVVDLPTEKEKVLNITLNKISGDWHMPKLNYLLEELNIGEIDIELTGFDTDEIEALMTQYNQNQEEAPFDFNEYDEQIETTYNCPKCGYEWS